MCRYKIRQEKFGAFIYDTRTCNLFSISEIAFKIINSIYVDSIDEIYSFVGKSKLEEFKRTLTEIDLLQNNRINGKIIYKGNFEKNLISAPIKVFLTITEKCNLNCKHCFGSFNFGENKKIETVKKEINRLSELGIFQISLTGGEPFLHPNILEIFEEVKKYNITCQVSTNGTVLDESVINYLKENELFRLSISLEGMRDYNDFIRGTGVYDKVVSNIKRLIDNDIKFGINIVLTSQNIDDFEEYINELYKIGVESISVSNLKPTGRILKHKNLLLDPNKDKIKINRVLDTVKDFARKTNKPQYIFGNTISNKGGVITQASNIGELIDINRCGAGIQTVTVKNNGIIIPCIFFEEILDANGEYGIGIDLLNDNFDEEWKNNQMFRKIRNIGICNYCENCKDYINKRCSGGCPVNSYYFTGDFEGKDGYCTK